MNYRRQVALVGYMVAAVAAMCAAGCNSGGSASPDLKAQLQQRVDPNKPPVGALEAMQAHAGGGPPPAAAKSGQ